MKYNPTKYGLPEGKDKEGRAIVARGAWGEWLRKVDIEDSQARRFITVAEKLGNRETSHDKGLDALYLIATMPEEAREIPHTVPSTGETKTVDEMTVRELREVKKALKEAEQSALQAETARRQAEQLDATTADFLRQKESNMRQIVGKAYTELGKELYEAQQELAKKGYGCFEGWCKSIGVQPPQARRLIHRYKSIRTLCSEQADLIEDLPVTLAYEVTGPSAESTPAKAQAKAEVLDGSIATLKEYRERIAELEAQAKQATEKAEQAEAARQIAEQDPIKKARIAQFLKEYWGVKEGRPNKLDHNGTVSKTTLDIAEVIGETERTTKRILKLNELIPQLQRLVSSGKLGTSRRGGARSHEKGKDCAVFKRVLGR